VGGKSILGAGLFWEYAHFWRERSIFGAHTIGGRKTAWRKRNKNNMQKKEEKQHGAHAGRPSHVRVRVLDMHVMAIIQ
jgi:hypothetical protein